FLVTLCALLPGVQKLTVTPYRGTTINISNPQGKGCKVCTGPRRCSTSVSLPSNDSVTLEFDCSKPQDVFNVEIVSNIGECLHHFLAKSGSLPLLDFNRRFTWNLKALGINAFRLDFANTGLRQINPSERCPDRHTYSLEAQQSTGNVALGKYCRRGTISSAQILNQGTTLLCVFQSSQFHLFFPLLALAKISLTLPKGASSSELLSPNYPDSFPDDDVMEWYFDVPDKHKVAVQFGNLTEPRCLKKETGVEYHSRGRGALVLSLMDTQPVQNQGSFSLTLRNCEMDRRRTGSPGLSLNLKVSASTTSSPGLYIICALLYSLCLVGLWVRLSSANVTDVSSTCCSRYVSLKDCPKATIPLLVPLLPSCLRSFLSSVTWTLRPGQHGTVQLTSPSGPIKQALPGQSCNGSIFIKLTEDDGTIIGHFCPRGAIQKIQIHTNVSVTWTPTFQGRIQRSLYKHVLNATFEKEVSDRYIFTVSPSKDTPVLLATPGWPVGMKPSSTVSWIVNVPPKMDAHLMFTNLTQPKCKARHTNIRVQRVGSPEEDYSRREDEETESEITVSESFYLNMSNCINFKQPKLFFVVSATPQILVFDISLIFSCLLGITLTSFVPNRKKKKQLDHQVSIYNPNGTNFLPGYNGFPKTAEENEYHVYASIEDTLVYTHLLKKGEELGICGEFDTYQPFAGQTDSQKPQVSKDTGSNNMETAYNITFSVSNVKKAVIPM
uniref:CUB domain containing protein 1a n=1 Tax=Acanthochromis polyacanthus TaxID=80966 RepID=A0A3Q1EFR2_9TELE